MATSVSPAIPECPRVIPETRPIMAKAALRKSENGQLPAQIGACLNVARHDVGWSLDELAAALGKDARQVRRWISGEERMQLEAVFSVPELRQPFVIALASLADCEVETVVRIRRRA